MMLDWPVMVRDRDISMQADLRSIHQYSDNVTTQHARRLGSSRQEFERHRPRPGGGTRTPGSSSAKAQRVCALLPLGAAGSIRARSPWPPFEHARMGGGWGSSFMMTACVFFFFFFFFFLFSEFGAEAETRTGNWNVHVEPKKASPLYERRGIHALSRRSTRTRGSPREGAWAGAEGGFPPALDLDMTTIGT
ncbi:hypothetical protein F5148DRAFT_600365 [Russula earlei]|uniref:Uncharacterized protein n=1 Tax=Russula earlei TaxID=71964 RepID=A0ACC0TWV4_9AGAM|nr:hypothetical protein F5148DRAFT_600365 [Russula earlei]